MSMARAHPRHAGLVSAAFDEVLRRKAMATGLFARRRTAWRAHRDQELDRAIAELDALRERLSGVLLHGTEEERQELIRAIGEREEHLSVLGSFLDEYRYRTSETEAERDTRLQAIDRWVQPGGAVRAALPVETALIEYVRYTTCGRGGGSRRNASSAMRPSCA